VPRRELVPPSALVGLTPDELQRILMGERDVDVDVGAIRAMAKYAGGYADDPAAARHGPGGAASATSGSATAGGAAAADASSVVRDFWHVVECEFDARERAALLRFVTGLPRVPLDGFDPPFTIAKAELFSDSAPPAAATEEGAAAGRGPRTTQAMQLPRSHTCFNQLALPPYPTRALLAQKLRFAVFNTDGFYLT
jgi:hypothetical protein